MSLSKYAAVLDRIVPASDFNHGKAAQAFSRVSVGNPVIVVNRSLPSYVIITPDEYRDYEELRQEREDALDLHFAQSRYSTWNGDPDSLVSHEELMDEFGITDEEIAALPDVELE